MKSKRAILLTTIGIITLFVSVFAATFAFFAVAMDENSETNIVVETNSSQLIFLATGTDLNLVVSASMMKEELTNNETAVLAGSSNTNLRVTLGSSQEDVMNHCTYDIIFFWYDTGNKYLYTEPTSPTTNWQNFNKEFTLDISAASVEGTSSQNAKDLTTTISSFEKNIGYDGICSFTSDLSKYSYENCTNDGKYWANGKCSKVDIISSDECTLNGGIYSNAGENINCYYFTEESCTSNEGEWQLGGYSYNYADTSLETENWHNGAYMTLVKNAEIYSDTIYKKLGSGTTVVWNIAMNFYNLPLNQNHLMNKNFKGRVEATNISC